MLRFTPLRPSRERADGSEESQEEGREEEGREEEGQEEVGSSRDIGGGWRPPTGTHPSGKGASPFPVFISELLKRFDDLAGLEASGTHPDALWFAGNKGSGGDEVGEPAPLGHVVRMADLVTNRGTLSTDLATSSHGRPRDGIDQGNLFLVA